LNCLLGESFCPSPCCRGLFHSIDLEQLDFDPCTTFQIRWVVDDRLRRYDALTVQSGIGRARIQFTGHLADSLACDFWDKHVLPIALYAINKPVVTRCLSISNCGLCKRQRCAGSIKMTLPRFCFISAAILSAILLFGVPVGPRSRLPATVPLKL